jgi:hypothetical protein
MGEMRIARTILMGTPEGKRSLEKPRHRRKDTIKTGRVRIGLKDVGSIHLAKDRD